jgi:4,5-dihydroxyphthalate decarboxylase
MTNSTQVPTLTTALRTHGHTAALKNGAVAVQGATLSFVDVEPQILAFRQMVRDVTYDVCELAPTTYIIAKAYGAPFTAIPIFFERRFHHAGLLVREDAGIRQPKDLEGKKVGVRAYSVTTGVLTRGILVNEFGLVGDDPLPYGLEVNRRSIETLILYASQQGLIPTRPGVDDLFLNLNV